MSDRVTDFFDLSPLGLPGWEHSAIWLRGADTLGGAAQLVAIRRNGAVIFEIVESQLPVGASPDPARLLQAIHDRVAKSDATPGQATAWRDALLIPPKSNRLEFLWSLFEGVSASRPPNPKDAT